MIVDTEALGHARDSLQLIYPVTVELEEIPDNAETTGYYYFEEGRHHIFVDGRCHETTISATIWHELAHAKQWEEAKACCDHYVPDEEQAHRFEDRHEAHPLVKVSDDA